MPNILVIGQGKSARELAEILGEAAGWRVVIKDARQPQCEALPLDAAIVALETAPAAPASSQIDRLELRCPVIAVSERCRLESDAASRDARFSDFLVWPFEPAEVRARVARVVARGRAARTEATAARVREQAGIEAVIGAAPSFLAIKAQLPQIARSQANVVILGETGTGKEVIARALHYLSPRASGRFVSVNCGAIPRELIENELFGHRRGAYTDAREPMPGLVAEAERGTLLLDEVDAIPLPGQVKLLQFLQSKRYRPLGGGELQADVRIIAATNRDLEAEVVSGGFREDLYYRLNIISVRLPPLRERTCDIASLAAHFMARHNASATDGGWSLSPELLDALTRHAWPGNVRELENLIERLVALNPCGPLPVDALPARLRSEDGPPAPTMLAPFRQAKAEAVAAFERKYAAELLAEHAGNISSAARAAGKDRRAFGRLVKKHHIDKMAPQQPGSFRPIPGCD